MSKQLPYYKMYPADAETDENFRLMSLEERGMFWTLLNHAWINDGIPFETMRLARLCGVTEDRFKALWKCVGECFYLDNGRMRNKRQEEERSYAMEKSRKATDAVRSRYERSTDESPRAYDSVSEYEAKEKKKKIEMQILETVGNLHFRHPSNGCGKAEIQKLLTTIVSQHGAEVLPLIDQNHAAWCATSKWKQGYARGLANWLAPSMKRWQDSPPMDQVPEPSQRVTNVMEGV